MITQETLKVLELLSKLPEKKQREIYLMLLGAVMFCGRCSYRLK